MKRSEIQAVNALRILSADMIENANSGHPGIAIDASPMAFSLWEKVMNFNQMILVGLIEIDLFYQLDMVLLYYIACCILINLD